MALTTATPAARNKSGKPSAGLGAIGSKGSGASILDLLKANDAVNAAQATQYDRGGDWIKRIQVNALTKKRDALAAAFQGGQPAVKPDPVGVPGSPKSTQPAPATPAATDTVDPKTSDFNAAANGNTDPTTPAAPAAVTNPQAQISDTEQQARLRARLMLMNNTTRGNGITLGAGGMLGYKSLIGF